MTDLVPPRATDPDTGSEDGPAPDNVLALAANAPPGGDGGSRGVGTDQDPGGDGSAQGVGTHGVLGIAPKLRTLTTASGDGDDRGVGTLTDDPGGDGGSEQGPTPDDPSGVLAEGNPCGDGSAEEHPNEDPPPGGAIHEITMG